MKTLRFFAAVVAAFSVAVVSAAPGDVQAQVHASAKVDQQDALNCSAVMSLMMAIAKDQNPSQASILQDGAVRWMIMAMSRSGLTAQQAGEEVQKRTGLMMNLWGNYGKDEKAFMRQLSSQSNDCMIKAAANRAEFEGIQVP